MPAIQPERLKRQSAELSQHFHNPGSFIRELSHLFEYYTNRAYHQGESNNPPNTLADYNIASPVTRRILLELNPLIHSHPDDAISLAESLWRHPIRDAHLLAISILGRIPVSKPDLIIDNITTWATDITDDSLIDNLGKQGLHFLLTKFPDSIILLVENSLASKHKNGQILGLICMQTLVDYPGFDNLPVIFKIISSYLHTVGNQFRPYLLDLIISLIEKSPKETALFLEKCVSDANNRIPRWLLRYSLDRFPDELQSRLRKKLRA